MPEVEELPKDFAEGDAASFMNLREAGIGFFQDERSKDRPVNVIIGHEDMTMLKKIVVWRLNKSPAEITKEIEDTIAKTKKEEGIVMQRAEVDDQERILLIEHREKPKLYIAKYSGSLKKLSEWMLGLEIVKNGVYTQVKQPHMRSWILGREDTAGNHTLSNDVQQNLAYYKESGRWSEILEISWEKMQQMER